MKQLAIILAILFLLAFTSSTGTYYAAIQKDSLLIDTTKIDTAALLSQIQPVADSLAHEAVRKIDSAISVPRFFVKGVDIERKVSGEVVAWIKIFKNQNGTIQYDTTIKAEIPNQ